MVMRCTLCLKLLKIVTSRQQQLSNVNSFLKLTLSSQYQALHLSRPVLNHVGFEVGPLRLPFVACTSEEAKRIIKVVLEEDVEATRETVTGVVRPDY